MLKIASFDSDSPLTESFLAFPTQLYAGDAYFRDNNQLPAESLMPRFFTVSQDGLMLGRICAMKNCGISYQQLPTGLLGYYECADNPAAAAQLFKAAAEYLTAAGCRFLIGPLNGDTWHNYRTTLPDSLPPFFLDNYHKPWYAEQFMQAGFNVIARYASRLVTDPPREFPRLEKFAPYFADRGITIRQFNPEAYIRDMTLIHTVSVLAFQNNFLYTTLRLDDFLKIYHGIQAYLAPEYVLLAESNDGEPLGFIFAVPDYFNDAKKTLVIKTVAVVGKARGLGTFLVEMVYQRALQAGYQCFVHALMHENNSSTKILNEGGRLFRHYCLFGRTL